MWEPLVFAYNELIDDEDDMKREAVLKYTGDDCARATGILDIGLEDELLKIYMTWLNYNMIDAQDSEDIERSSFFAGL